MSRIHTVAIIGGGVSGLSAGGLLSRSGLRVSLYEANAKLGGSCANTEIGGYAFHDGALYLAMPGILEHVFERLGIDRPSLLPLRKIAANQTTTLPDGTVVTIGSGRDVRVRRQGEAKQDHLLTELDRMLKKWEPVLRLFEDDILLRPLSISRLVAKGWRHLPKLRGSVASELHNLFGDEAVRSAMSGVLLYAGTPPQKTPVQSILGLVAMLTEGFYLPDGGMGSIPEALSQSVKNNGGEIFLNSKVDNIVVRNGHVVGLQVDGHGIIETDAVISTASGMATFGSLVNAGDVPNSMRRKVQNAPLSHRALVVQLGLSNQIDVCSHSNSILPMMDNQDQVFVPDPDRVRWPVYSVPTVTMPTLAPKGGSIVEVFPPVRQNMPADDWDNEEKERIAELAVHALSRHHNLEIAVTRVQSPKEFQDRMHLYKGAAYGLSPSADLHAYFPHATPIVGLFQAGQTTYPGYGVSSAAMSGILAAEALMRTDKR